jgi:hypothetical protein
MGGKTRPSLAFDAATLDLDGLRKKLHLANARGNWRRLLSGPSLNNGNYGIWSIVYGKRLTREPIT